MAEIPPAGRGNWGHCLVWNERLAPGLTPEVPQGVCQASNKKPSEEQEPSSPPQNPLSFELELEPVTKDYSESTTALHAGS